jgi:hypothetical protein
MSYTSGPQGGISFGVPRYRQYIAKTPFVPISSVNPLDDNQPHLFNRILGKQYLSVLNESTGFEWKLELEGGWSKNADGSIGSYSTSSNYTIVSKPYNCTYTPLLPTTNSFYQNRFQIDTSSPDSRQYILEYSPFTLVQPRITLVGPDIGNATVDVNTTYYRFISG